MKSYELKDDAELRGAVENTTGVEASVSDLTSNLSLKGKIVVSSKRIAYLVPDVFRKLKSGVSKVFKNGVNVIKTGVSNATKSISASYQDKYNPEQARKEALEEVEKRKTSHITNLEEKREEKEAAIENAKYSNVSGNEKSYIIKAYESDIDKIIDKELRVFSSPRRLLISTIFLGKLITNRKARLIKDIEEKKAQRALEKQEKEKLTQNEAVDLYVEKYNKRIALLNEVKKLEKEMNSIVKENGLTEAMVRDRFESKKTMPEDENTRTR